MLPSRASLHDVLDAVWRPMLDIDVNPIDAIDEPVRFWRGDVGIEGACTATVTLECAEPLLESAACRLLLVEHADADAIAETIGELSNMVAGIIKGTMPGPSTLSLPSVSPTAAIPEPGARTVRASFSCRGQPVRLTVQSPGTALATANGFS